MRGKAGSGATEAVSLRITPARAGKRSGRRCPECFWWDHPRACGEKWHTCPTRSGLRGSPPRVRGKVRGQTKPDEMHRITPAHAGKSPGSDQTRRNAPDHPRACGEKPQCTSGSEAATGSPPRMRGKEFPCNLPDGTAGITPAHAGKRWSFSSSAWSARDHPRACGEKCHDVMCPNCMRGSPPRMRGKASTHSTIASCTGITPAHAGKRVSVQSARRNSRDHPRACGEKTKKIP